MDELKTYEYRYAQYVAKALAEAEADAASPDAVWLDAHVVLQELREEFHGL